MKNALFIQHRPGICLCFNFSASMIPRQGFQYRIRICDFHVDLYRISVSGATKGSRNVIKFMVVGKQLCCKRCILLAFAVKLHRDNQH